MRAPAPQTVRSRLSFAVAGALALAGLTVPATPSSAAAPAAERARCARASAPFDVGTKTVTVRSRGQALRTTIAYPATSDGEGATPVCRRSRLVVAGHGSGGDGESAARLHYYLVERGYVVAAPTFPSGGYDWDGFAKDVSATITKARRLSNRSRGVLANRLKGKVGYIGTSMGGIIGLELVDKGSRDRRINAVIPKAGAHYGGDFRTRGGPPLLMIHGNRDTVVDYSDGRASYRQARRPKGFITLEGVDHSLNTGGDPIMSTSSTLFFDRFLRGKSNALHRLQRAVRHSDIANLRKRW